MKVLYRISDGGHTVNKPYYVNDKKQMFIHFITVFQNYDIYVFADNVSDETYNFLISIYDTSKIFRISLGNGKSFMHTLDFAIQHFKNDKVYFAEDDYIYKKIAPQIIEEGLNISHYSSGYDHPDKYMNHSEGGPNPYIQEGGEITRVLVSNSIHWKLTNSCCMTFADHVNVLIEDYNIFNKHCPQKGVPNDFKIFCELIQNKNRKLVSCIPGVSTHGQNEYMSKFVDWNNEFTKTK